jgi:RHS repeat-associated protein
MPVVGSPRPAPAASPPAGHAQVRPPEVQSEAPTASFSDASQRLYFSGRSLSWGGAPTVTFSPEWNETSSAGRYMLVSSPSGSSSGTHGQPHGQSILNKLHRQFMFELDGAGTLEGWVRAFLRTRTRYGTGINEGAQNMISQMIVRVVSSNGSVVRGTALSAYNPPNSTGQTKWDAWALRNRKFPSVGRWEHPTFGAMLNPIAYQDGDWLVVEVGLRNFTTLPTGGSSRYNDSAGSDLPADETTTTDLRSWIEFHPPTPLSTQLLGMCSAGHVSCPWHAESDPVNTATGNYLSAASDLTLPGIGLPFSFTRAYNSLDTRISVLGRGWRHAYDASLTIGTDGSVRFNAEDGAQITYWPLPGGGYSTPHGSFSTLVKLGGGTYELTRKDHVVYSFDSAGKLTTIEDRNGNALTFAYTSNQLTTITDTAGRTVNLTYHGSGRLASIAGPPSRTVSYTYDANGNLETVTDATGEVWTYGYDSQQRLETITDPNAHVLVTNEYGSDGRVSAQTDATGNRGTFSWDPVTETSTYTDARDNEWIDRYEQGLLVEREDPLGNITSYDYDGDFNLTAVTDPRGFTTTMTYDQAGNLLTRTAPGPLSYVETWTYTALNVVESYTDGRSNTTEYDYDADGNLIEVSAPLGAVTTFTRDPSGTGLLTELTDPRDKTTTYAYDADGNLASITTPLGHESTMEYDAAGRLVESVDGRGNADGADPADYTTTFTYDAADHLLTATDPLSNVTTWAYDDAGNLESVTDANSNPTTYAYDAANRMTAVTDGDAGVTSYTYDDVGNLLTRTDANDHDTSYAYDDANRLTSTTDPLTNVWTLTYDDAGNVDSRTDANGKTTTYTWDALNRLTGITYHDTSTPSVTFAYDANGNRTTMTDGAGTETATFDALNRLTGVTRGSNTFGYGYDLAGNVTSRTYPGQSAQTWTYDDDGQLANANGASYEYDAAGNLLTAETPDGIAATHSYDPAGRLREIAHVSATETLARATYTLDDVGNRIVASTVQGTQYYTYDDLNRLTGVCYDASCAGSLTPASCLECVGSPMSLPAPDLTPNGSDVETIWTYDPVGNRLTEETYQGTTAYDYDDADRLTSVDPPGSGPITYTYDDNGNQTAAGSDTFAWDYADRLVSATVNSATETYTYAGDGVRLSADRGSGDETHFLVDRNFGLPQVAIEIDSTDAVVRSYAYGLEPVSQVTPADGTLYLHADGLGSVIAATDPTGDPLAWSAYQPFGELRSFGVVADPPGLAFTGQFVDAATGLYHLRARQYDAATGRFLTTDPLAPRLSDPYVAAYVYAGNQPIRFTDPSGKCFIVCGAIVGAVIGGVVSAITYTAGTVLTGGDPTVQGFVGSLAVGAVSGAISGGTLGLASGLALPALETAVLQGTGGYVAGLAGLAGSRLAGNSVTPAGAVAQMGLSVFGATWAPRYAPGSGTLDNLTPGALFGSGRAAFSTGTGVAAGFIGSDLGFGWPEAGVSSQFGK